MKPAGSGDAPSLKISESVSEISNGIEKIYIQSNNQPKTLIQKLGDTSEPRPEKPIEPDSKAAEKLPAGEKLEPVPVRAQKKPSKSRFKKTPVAVSEGQNPEQGEKEGVPAVKKRIQKKMKFKQPKTQNFVRLNMKQGYKERLHNRGLKIRYTKNGRLKQKYVKRYEAINKETEEDNDNLLDKVKMEDASESDMCEQKAAVRNQPGAQKPSQKSAAGRFGGSIYYQCDTSTNKNANLYLSCLSPALKISLCDAEARNEGTAADRGPEEKIDFKQAEADYSPEQTYSEELLTSMLHQVYGFDNFRYGQLQAIQHILHRQSCLAVLSTGHGKSLMYQIPSLIMPGLTLVISPLISLMIDQLSNLPTELPGACLNSNLSYEQKQKIIAMVREKKVKILYIAPEQLQSELMMHIKSFPPINFVCIDEVHCVSEWSHNFRTSYLIIDSLLKNKLGSPTILGLTATATQQTQLSICEKLKIQNVIQQNSSQRSNLYCTISRDPEKNSALLKLIKSPVLNQFRSIIVYCMFRRNAENISNFLTQNGVSSATFHAGCEEARKTQIQ